MADLTTQGKQLQEARIRILAQEEEMKKLSAIC
jgi:hypothetical protein